MNKHRYIHTNVYTYVNKHKSISFLIYLIAAQGAAVVGLLVRLLHNTYIYIYTYLNIYI